MNKKKTKRQTNKEIYQNGYEAGKEYERTENLALIKRAEQAKLYEVEEMVSKRMGELLGTNDETKIITWNQAKGIVFLGGKRMDATELNNYRADAEFIMESGLWKAIEATLTNDAQDRIFNRSKDFQDMLNGKMALYNLSLIKKILAIFKSVNTATLAERKVV